MTTCSQATIDINTDQKIQLVDITPRVKEIIHTSGIAMGHAIVFSPHTTSGIIINENEPRLISDFKHVLATMMSGDVKFRHDEIDNNCAAHLTGALIGNHAYIIVEDGGLKLGCWQSVFFVELDGPRPREVFIQVSGESQ